MKNILYRSSVIGKLNYLSISIVLTLLLNTNFGLAQTGAIKVRLSDSVNAKALPFASVIIEQNGTRISANQTNFDGEVLFTNLLPGEYTVKVSFVGYYSYEIKGRKVFNGKTSYVPIKLSGPRQTDTFREYKVPLIDSTKTGKRKDVITNFVDTCRSENQTIISIEVSHLFSCRGCGTTIYTDGVRIPTIQSSPPHVFERKWSRTENKIHEPVFLIDLISSEDVKNYCKQSSFTSNASFPRSPF